MTVHPHTALARRFVAAIEAGDIDAVREIYAPDARIWHNHDGREQGREDNLKVLGWMVKTFKARKYLVRDLQPTPEGFVQQHVLEAETLDGRQLRLPACLVVAVKDGRITRLDEYFDSAALGPLKG